MTEESRNRQDYAVDLTAMASNMVVLPSFSESLKCCVSMDRTIDLNMMRAPGNPLTHLAYDQSSILYCTVPFVENHPNSQNMELAPKNCERMAMNNNVIDGNAHDFKLKIEPDCEKCEELATTHCDVIHSEDIFTTQGNPIYFNISPCEEFISELQENPPNAIDNSIQFISSLMNPQVEEILEQIPNAVDFSQMNRAGESNQIENNGISDEQNRQENDCPTPDTISVSSLSAQDINEASVQLGSYPESIIHQIANNLPRYNGAENSGMNESFKVSYNQQYQYASIMGQLQIDIPEQKPQCVPTKTEYDAYPQQYYCQQLPCLKSEHQKILFEQQQHVGVLTMQPCNSQCLLPQPPPLHYLYPSQNNADGNAPNFLNHAAPLPPPPPPIADGNFAPNPNPPSLSNFNFCSTPKSNAKPNVDLENLSKISSKKNSKKASKRKLRDVENIGADPDVKQYIKILLQRLGLPSNYKFDFINGGHGIKNPRFFYDKLNSEISPSLRMLSSDTSSSSSSGGENKIYPYLCAICFKSFEMRRLLNRHQKCHSDVKRYLCTFCAKGFNDTFDLKRHTRTHTGVRPYKCAFCEKSFTQRCSLEMHCLKVHNVGHTYKYKERRAKVYVCEECGNTTCKSESHYMHLKSFHPYSPALMKFYDKRHFKFTDSKFANDLLGQLSTKIQIQGKSLEQIL